VPHTPPRRRQRSLTGTGSRGMAHIVMLRTRLT